MPINRDLEGLDGTTSRVPNPSSSTVVGKTVTTVVKGIDTSTVLLGYSNNAAIACRRLTHHVLYSVTEDMVDTRDGTGSETLTRDPTRPGRLVTRDP